MKIPYQNDERLSEKIKEFIKKPCSIIDVANEFNISPKRVEQIIERLGENKYNIITRGEKIELSEKLSIGGKSIIDIKKFENKLYRIGFIGDNHLCSKFSRLDVLNALYDIYEQEGIKEVYNAGNWIDGEAPFNKFDLIANGVTPQIEYFIKHYPKRKGIITYLIAGDDHEGWFIQRERINIGEYMELKAVEAGRHDLKYIGYVEADVEFKAKHGKATMKVIHGGGGSAYALSYSPQKLIESFSGGEKPQIVLIGHYHKFDYIFYRNVIAIQVGTTQDQTVFMRKKKLQAHVGGGILEFQVNRDGAISRAKVEWIPFFDTKYYKKKGYYR